MKNLSTQFMLPEGKISAGFKLVVDLSFGARLELVPSALFTLVCSTERNRVSYVLVPNEVSVLEHLGISDFHEMSCSLKGVRHQ